MSTFLSPLSMLFYLKRNRCVDVFPLIDVITASHLQVTKYDSTHNPTTLTRLANNKFTVLACSIKTTHADSMEVHIT